MRAVDAALRWCDRILHALAVSCLVAILIINVVNIVLRNVTGESLGWVFPWSVVLFVWMTFLAFFPMHYRKRDIAVDLLIKALGPHARLPSRLFVNAVTITLIGVILWHAPQTLAAQKGPIVMVGLGRYVLSIPLFLSCGLILVNMIKDTLAAISGTEEARANSAESLMT